MEASLSCVLALGPTPYSSLSTLPFQSLNTLQHYPHYHH